MSSIIRKGIIIIGLTTLLFLPGCSGVNVNIHSVPLGGLPDEEHEYILVIPWLAEQDNSNDIGQAIKENLLSRGVECKLANEIYKFGDKSAQASIEKVIKDEEIDAVLVLRASRYNKEAYPDYPIDAVPFGNFFFINYPIVKTYMTFNSGVLDLESVLYDAKDGKAVWNSFCSIVHSHGFTGSLRKEKAAKSIVYKLAEDGLIP